MKNVIQSALLITAMVLTGLDVRADTRILTVPGQYWSDGQPRPTLKWAFFTTPYYPYDAYAQCSMAARQLHTAKISPNYSACTTEYTARQYK